MALAEIRGGRTEAARRRDAALLRDALHGMMCETAAGLNDGYVTRQQALDCCLGEAWKLELLTRPVLGKPPWLHQPGQKCAERNCIDASPPWVDGFGYRICAYLKRNPSRAEKRLQDAKKRDSKDPRLRTMVYKRDGGCCRYCRSGPLKRLGMFNATDKRRVPQWDHPDPDRHAEDGDNYVLACARCNREKSANDIARTPDEAGMVLLPEPTEELKAWWAERGEQLFDRPEAGELSPADELPYSWADAEPDTAADTDPDTPLDTHPDTESDTERAVSPTVSGAVSDDGVVRPESPGDGHDHPSSVRSMRSGSGRVGRPAGSESSAPETLPPPGQFDRPPARAPDAPDIYTHRSRGDPEPVPRTRW